LISSPVCLNVKKRTTVSVSNSPERAPFCTSLVRTETTQCDPRSSDSKRKKEKEEEKKQHLLHKY